jgi:hypothetical protein
MTRDQALDVIYQAIDTVNPQLPAPRRLAKSPQTIIVGPSGSLDSLGIVNFVVALEEKAGDLLGAPIQLLDEHALVDENGAFRTVDTLARFLEQVQRS